MSDGSVFYGETEYYHKETGEIIYNYDELTEPEKAKIKIIRHGYGIQLFGKNENNILVKYAG
jgi:calcineurin-like phosphoesterase